MQIKFFAGKTEVDVYRNSSPGEHIETKQIKLIVDGILQKYPHINCNFELPRDIRNCLLHGNLQQLKTIIEPTLSADQKKYLDPKMAVLSLKTNEGKNIRYAADPFTKEEAKGMGPFFWFLSQGNTRLLGYAADILESSLLDIKRISALHAFSHHETTDYFEQVAIRGQPLTSQQREIFISSQGHHINSDRSIVEAELNKMLSLFSLQ